MKNKQNIILPFNFNLDGILLKYATTQLITKLSEEKLYVFLKRQVLKMNIVLITQTLKR